MFVHNLLSEFIINDYGCVSNEINYRDDLKQIFQDEIFRYRHECWYYYY